MQLTELKTNQIVTGPFFPEPVKITIFVQMGTCVQFHCEGVKSGQVYKPYLNVDQIADIKILPES